MSGSDIFISYAREDEGVARLFAQAFGHEGFNVWWDAAIHSGETFDEVIENELRNAKAVVVLWSPRSVASRWVRAEATLADRNKTLAPAIIEPCNRPIIFELTHTVDLSHWTGDTVDTAWQVFVNDIRRLVGTDRPSQQGAAMSGGSRPRPVEAVAPAHHKPGSQSSEPAPTPAPVSSGNPAADALAGGNVENLISMLSSLQQAINLNTAGQAGAAPPATPAPATPELPEQDESEATQFYTHSDHFSLLEGDEFHCLEVGVGDEIENRYIVGPLGLKIGRSAPADVILADSKVSRSHCLVEVKDDTLFVTDLNSTNGTYVDGKKVAGAAIVPVGGILTIGHYSLAHQIRKRDEIS